jgi:dTDP-L-rhamnose 4-epimerase
MSKRILLTGGAGFVGSHTADALLQRGHHVRVFDNLSPQVHPNGRPSYLSSEVEFIKGDVRNVAAVARAVRGVDVIYHFAAAVGVGQSMYEIAEYTSVNMQGTANLLQAVLNGPSKPEKIVVASSMSIYGEGRYLCSLCGEVAPQARTLAQLKDQRWDIACPICHAIVTPTPTDEGKPQQCTSIYALSKKMQEEMVLLFGKTYGIPSVALRYFNIYGSRQALSNPYTGVAAIFAARLMNGNSPLIFEDGAQWRDFVSVHDIVQANLLAMQSSGADGMAVNVGSGKHITILQVASQIASALGAKIRPSITGKYRAGDIRHNFADISLISETLGYRPQVGFRDGVKELVNWLGSQNPPDEAQAALEDLSIRGLVA